MPSNNNTVPADTRQEDSMNSAVTVLPQPSRSLTASDIRHRVNTIQEVMTAVMKKDVHYGIIPGCKKPSLYKPGSEVLLATFQIATSIHVTDLSTEDCVRYQVRVIGTHAPSGMLLGEGIGECSSNEEKYKWRKAFDDEWNATPENRRRIKFGKYKDKQVRTEPADVANTILKMAKKRAQVDMTLTTTGASDCFEQDIEDIPEDLRDFGDRESAPVREKAPLGPYNAADFDRNLASWLAVIESGRKTADEIIAMVESKGTLTAEQKAAIRGTPKAEPKQAEPIESEVVDQDPSA